LDTAGEPDLRMVVHGRQAFVDGRLRLVHEPVGLVPLVAMYGSDRVRARADGAACGWEGAFAGLHPLVEATPNILGDLIQVHRGRSLDAGLGAGHADLPGRPDHDVGVVGVVV